ncbi:hypothetical protein MMC07_008664 [Pseudocyphellaria aurata]|nr:hypothetical protein [Pseudocyphellaria aurata]
MDLPRPTTPRACSSTSESFPGTRLTTYSLHPFHEVIGRLYHSIGHDVDRTSSDDFTNIPRPLAKFPAIMERDEVLQNEGKTTEIRGEIFQEGVKAALGPSDFMFFAEFDYGNWIQLFLPSKPRRCKRIVLGNPLIAITMLKHDLNAGLAVPVELLLVEDEKMEEGKETRGTRIIYQLPSALIAGLNTNPELREAAETLDEKLEALVTYIAS